MDHNHYSPRQGGKHLNETQRTLLEKLRIEGYSVKRISEILGKHRSTLYRELRRGKVEQLKWLKGHYRNVVSYSYQAGEYRYQKARKLCHRPVLLDQIPGLKQTLEAMIHKEDGSPEIVLNKLKSEFEYLPCIKTLYRWIDEHRLKVRNLDLLRKTSRKTKREHAETHRINGRSIEERPEVINLRSEVGHWEIDTIIGRKKGHKPVLLSLVERTSRKAILCKLPDKSSDSVKRALDRVCHEHPSELSSLTSDNGWEFSQLPQWEEETHIPVYFAHPYSAYERGTNENYNGLVRRFFPKGTDFTKISEDKIHEVEQRINNMPRKLHGFKSSSQVYAQMLKSKVGNNGFAQVNPECRI